MRYIENSELREWIKEKLSKAIFQKAHALAIQTGCEVLVKLEDVKDTTGSQYYATNTLEHVFINNGLRKKHGDLPVSGDTGMPINPMVDTAVQSTEENSTSDKSMLSTLDDIAQRLSNRGLESGDAPAVPMQLTLADGTVPQSQNGQSPIQSTQTDTSTEQTDLDVTVKIEPNSDDQPPDPGDPNRIGDNVGTSFSMDTDSNSQSLHHQPQLFHQEFLGGLTRDTKLYPVPISPKPYQCAVCHKAFRSVQVLQKHTQTFHMRVGVMPRRGRGRGRPASFARSHTLSHAGPPLQQSRFLCVICSRVFSEAHLLKEHIEHSHGGQEVPPPASQSSFEDPLSIPPSQLPGDISFPMDNLPGGDPQILDDIPGPSTSDGSAVSMSQIPSGSMVPFSQPQNVPFTSPPPQAFGGFATPSAPPRVSNMGSAQHGGTPVRFDFKPKSAGFVRKQAVTMEEVNNVLTSSYDGTMLLKEDLKQTLHAYAYKPTLVARILANKLFTREERVNGNCTGVGCKEQMDPVRMDILRSAVFEICSLHINEFEQEKMWKKIKNAIDASNRIIRFNKSHE